MKAIRTSRAFALTLLCVSALPAQTPQSKIVTATNAFLATLDEKQRQSVLFAFDDEEQRARWSNFPTGVVRRAGINLRDMNPTQRTAALAVMSTVLSRRGYEKVQQIMDGDEANKTASGNAPPPGNGPPPSNGAPKGGGNGGPKGGGKGGPRGGPGGGDLFGKDLYYISFLGTPSDKNPWMLQFGGHHLALNITISPASGTSRSVLTPTLTGAQPALYTLDGKTIRPLGAESDKAAALLNAFDDNQRKQAILNYRVSDLVLGPGQDGKTIQPEGLKASSMNDKQRTMLLDVISEWAGIVHDTEATARMAELKADLPNTWFAWSGPANPTPGTNITAYYRIQGPHLVIEYAPQQLGGDPALHVHTMYRDPTNDYGRKSATK